VSAVRIRPYSPEDRAAIRALSIETAFMGGSLENQYRDKPSLADILTAHYTDNEPENALVAEQDGEVVGYLLSCRDARKVRDSGSYALEHVFKRGVCFRPGTFWFYVLTAIDLIADIFHKGAPKIDLAKYPCHTHSNFKPGFRGAGVGTEMFYRLFDHYKRQGVHGMHATVMAANVKTLRWAEAKLGYRCHGEPYYVPGLRDAQGNRMKLQMIVRELDNWEIEGWKKPGFKP
jgi:GNAT superfamily N-acetyltransferase